MYEGPATQYIIAQENYRTICFVEKQYLRVAFFGLELHICQHKEKGNAFQTLII